MRQRRGDASTWQELTHNPSLNPEPEPEPSPNPNPYPDPDPDQVLLMFVAPVWIFPLFNTFTPLPEGEP